MVQTSNNPLTWVPKQFKAVTYGVLSLAALVYFAYMAAEGDWMVAIGSILTALGFGVSLSNVGEAKYKPLKDPRDYEDGGADVATIIICVAISIVVVAVALVLFDGRR